MLHILQKNTVGIDIADRSIELVELVGGGSLAQIKSFNRAKFGGGIVERGKIVDEDKLEEVIKKLFKEASPYRIKPGTVYFSIPEAQVYTLTIALEDHKKKDRKKLISEEIVNSIPLSEDNLVYTYSEQKDKKGNVTVFVTAAPSDVLYKWQQFFKDLKIRVKFDFEIFATRRAVIEEKIKKPVCLIDIGAVSTHVAVFEADKLKLTYSFYKAGEFINSELSKNLSIDLTAAAKLKKEVSINGKDKKADGLKKSLDPIIKEIKSSLEYWYTKSDHPLEQVILLGGSSKIKGLAEYLSGQLELPVVLASSTLHDKKAKLVYLGAIGAALRGIDTRWKSDPTLEPVEKKKKVKKNSDEPVHKKVKKKTVEEPEQSGNKSKLILLLIILIVGAGLVFAAFIYKNKQKEKLNEAKKAALEFEVPIVDEVIIEEVIESKPTIVITDTPTGFLNIRQGPGTSFEIIEKVYPEDEFVFTEVSGDWYRIELSTTTAGWAFSDYVDEINR